MNLSKLDLGQLVDKATGIMNAADKSQRDLTAAEAKELDGIIDEAEKRLTDMEQQQRLAAAGSARRDRFDCLVAAASASAGRVTEPQGAHPDAPVPASPLTGVESIHAGSNPSGLSHELRLARGRMRNSFASLFGQAATMDTGGFSDLEEWFRCIANGMHDPRIRAATMTEGTGADGGFLVPTQYVSELLDASLEMEVIRPLATVYPMSSNALSIAGVDFQDHSTEIGGLVGNWMAENETATAQKADFRAVNLKANKLGIFTEASNELAEDGLGFQMQLSNAMTRAIGFDVDYAFIQGDGVAKPLGILNAGSKITVAKESGQAADSLVFENIVNMWARLHPALASDAIWIANPNALPQLFTMSFEGTSGSVPAFMPAGTGVTGTAPATLMGRPLIFTEKCSTVGDEGDIILVAPSQYAIGLRRDATLQRSIDTGFMRDVSTWRLILRVCGTPLWDSVVTPRNGSTLSWCVTLAARA